MDGDVLAVCWADQLTGLRLSAIFSTALPSLPSPSMIFTFFHHFH
jgi:hypothetical protein